MWIHSFIFSSLPLSGLMPWGSSTKPVNFKPCDKRQAAQNQKRESPLKWMEKWKWMYGYVWGGPSACIGKWPERPPWLCWSIMTSYSQALQMGKTVCDKWMDDTTSNFKWANLAPLSLSPWRKHKIHQEHLLCELNWSVPAGSTCQSQSHWR